MTWSAIASDLLDAMRSSGVLVDREIITPGPQGGARCRQFLVHPVSPQALPFPSGRLAGTDTSCSFVPHLALMARFTANCAPLPGDDGSQPDAAEMTAWTITFLDEAQRVWNAIVDEAPTWACNGATVGQGVFSGPTGGTATMSVPILVMDDGLPPSGT